MKLVVGLGNIGTQYSNTRHNIGFLALDALLKDLGLEITDHDFNGDYCEADINGERYIFMKPTTLMNLSGNCVGPIAQFYKIPVENIIVVHDDLDLQPGQYKIRTCGSAGGHNGIKSIISSLGNRENFIRFKIGIGHPTNKDVVGHVLSKFSPEQAKLNQKPIAKFVEFVKDIMIMDVNKAISKINQGK